jgi:nicotinamide-nucleotide amidase
MLGRVLNTHQQWLCRKLSDLGYEVSRQVAIADEGHAIQNAVREALARADIVIVTGGLGPTSDDITRDLIAQLLQRQLNEDSTVLAAIREFYRERSLAMQSSVQVQALVPEGAMVLQNHFGTAPGLAIEIAPNPFKQDASLSWLILLPGPPRELYPMFDKYVAPLLKTKMPLSEPYACHTLKTTGMGESSIEEIIAGPLREWVARGLSIGYCARVREVDVRLESRGSKASEIVAAAVEIVRRSLPGVIFSEDESSLETAVIRALIEQGKTVATAESCTGGLIANRLTHVPGASDVFMAGLVTYSNESKVRLLGVPLETIERHGAVSAETAKAMAEGAKRTNQTQYAIATTGIAGPSGGTPEKPVGTVFVALAGPGETVVQRYLNLFEREMFKQAASQQALEMLRQALMGRTK